ncbi:Transcriptional repressor CTCF-like 1 [Homarus americanus]|uniref:Transcriptional repressor CTCF-like 1 n=1 Tax=Homarus americanus TaxID=6706 RepID=A0A8J5MT92_HOMAM|nr:Transcriptional repressor CTCF-like 1 [Homarus americanus]
MLQLLEAVDSHTYQDKAIGIKIVDAGKMYIGVDILLTFTYMERQAQTDGRRTTGEWQGLNTSGMMHECPHCAYSTVYLNQLWKHISSMHTGAKPYICPYCPYRTTRNTLLKEHINTHTGERPFSCSYCPYSSSHRNILKRHIRTHTGEKPYTCTMCSYRAASKTNLNSHLLTHKKKDL